MDLDEKLIRAKDEFTYNYLTQEYGGVSVFDSLLLDNLKDYVGEQIYYIYKQKSILDLFLKGTKVGVHKAKLEEAEVILALDKINNGKLTLPQINSQLDLIDSYLQKRIEGRSNTRMAADGRRTIDGFSILSQGFVDLLKNKYDPDMAAELEEIMKRNVFGQGIASLAEDLPDKVRTNILATLHFHIEKDFSPPSVHDLSTSNLLPIYVGSYSANEKRSKIYSAYNGSFREIGEIANDPSVNGPAMIIAERPSINISKKKGDFYKIECSSNTSLKRVLIAGITPTELQIIRNYSFDEGQKTFSLEVGFDLRKNRSKVPEVMAVYALDRNYGGMAKSETIKQKI